MGSWAQQGPPPPATRLFSNSTALFASTAIAVDAAGTLYYDESTGLVFVNDGQGNLIQYADPQIAIYQGAPIGSQSFAVASGTDVVIGSAGNFEQLGTQTFERPASLWGLSGGVVASGVVGQLRSRFKMIFELTAVPRNWTIEMQRDASGAFIRYGVIWSGNVQAGNTGITAYGEVVADFNNINPNEELRVVVRHDGMASQTVTVTNVVWVIEVIPIP